MVCEGNAVSPVDAQRTVACKYARAGQIVARTANGIRQTYEYDKKGQLLAVKDADGNAVERYVYDKAGNMLKKTVGGKTITFTFGTAWRLSSAATSSSSTSRMSEMRRRSYASKGSRERSEAPVGPARGRAVIQLCHRRVSRISTICLVRPLDLKPTANIPPQRSPPSASVWTMLTALPLPSVALAKDGSLANPMSKV